MNEIKRTSFVLYTEWGRLFRLLEKDDAADLIIAVFDYIETGKKPNLPYTANALFEVFKTRLDIDGENYRKKCEKNAAAGRKSGEARRARANANMEEQTRTFVEPEITFDEQNKTFVEMVEPNKTKRTEYDSESEYESDNEILKNNICALLNGPREQKSSKGRLKVRKYNSCWIDELIKENHANEKIIYDAAKEAAENGNVIDWYDLEKIVLSKIKKA